MISLLTAFGLMLVLEGLLPFLAPRLWRDAFRQLIESNDGQVRFMGLLSVCAGASLVLIAR